MAFLPADDDAARDAEARIEAIAAEEHLAVLGWRDLPTNPEGLGNGALSVMPRFRQLFLTGTAGQSGIELDRLAFALRKRAERDAEVYFPSLSSRTLVYKGMLTTAQLETFFPDLLDERFASAIGLVHSRFSTNTFPAWPLAHPYRFVAHNGEINTVIGQPELDAGPRVRPGNRSDLAAIWTASSRSAPPAPPTPRPSTRPWSCCTWPAAACRTPC